MKTLSGCGVLAAACLTLCGFETAASAGRPSSSCSEVLLVSERGERDPAGLALAARLERPVDYYVGEEPAFVVRIVPVVEFKKARDAANVVICGVLTAETELGRFMGGIVGEETAESLRSDRSAVYVSDEFAGPGGRSIVVTALSDADLMRCVERRGDEIVDLLEAGCRERLRRYFADRLDEELSRRLHDRYGFTLEVPESYRVLAEGSSPAGVQLLCDGPARLLGVFWLDWDRPPEPADSTRFFRARSEYVWRAYDGDVMDSTRVAYRAGRLGNNEATVMSGYWNNSRSVAGGCYQTFFVYEPGEKLLWGLDLLVFAPGMPKHPLFRELNAIAETFRYD